MEASRARSWAALRSSCESLQEPLILGLGRGVVPGVLGLDVIEPLLVGGLDRLVVGREDTAPSL